MQLNLLRDKVFKGMEISESLSEMYNNLMIN